MFGSVTRLKERTNIHYKSHFSWSVLNIITQIKQKMGNMIKSKFAENQLNHNYKDIGDRGVATICCEQNTSIINSLQLQENNITPIGLAFFSLPKWDRLSELNLYMNFVGNKGCKQISRASLPHIKLTILSKNEIGSAGVLHLSKAKWPSIEEVYLSTNKLGVDSVRWLAKAKWNKIKGIVLCCNKITIAQMTQLLCFDSKQLRKIWFWWNEIDNYMADQLKNTLQLKFGKLSKAI